MDTPEKEVDKRVMTEADPLLGSTTRNSQDGSLSVNEPKHVTAMEPPPASSVSNLRTSVHRRASQIRERVLDGLEYYKDFIDKVEYDRTINDRRFSMPVSSSSLSSAKFKAALSLPLSSELHGQSRHSLSAQVREELYEIADAFVDEFRLAAKASRGTSRAATNNYFLESNLTRHFSILPEDVEAAALAVRKMDTMRSMSIRQSTAGLKMTPEEIEKLVTTTSPEDATKEEPVVVPFSAYLLLFGAVVGLSSAGPLLNMQSDVNTLLKVYWRMTATWMLMLPFAVYSVYKHGLPTLRTAQWLSMLAATFFFAHCCNTFALALDYTTVGNVVILTNTQSLILLAGKLFVGQTLILMEGVGAVVAFLGAVLCVKDASETDSADDVGPSAGLAYDSTQAWIGDLFGILTAFLGVGYLILAKTIRPHICLYVFMFLITFVGTMNVLLVMVLTNVQLSFDRDAHHGLFGWMNWESDRLGVELAMVLFCNMLGLLGYVRAMQYFDPLVISVSALLEPVVAALLAVGLGVGVLPGVYGWIGNVLVFGGTLAVVSPTSSKETGDTDDDDDGDDEK